MKVSLARALVVFVLICAPVTAVAQDNESGKGWRPLFVAGAVYDATTRTTGEVGVLIPFKLGWDEDMVFRQCLCLEATAGVGQGGSRFTVGPSFHALGRPILPYGMDALLTIRRTSDSPRGVMAQSTYVGGEAGLVYMSARIGLGVAHRASGPGPRDTVFTWNVGFRTGW
ncbi:MAG TPA: hypothetical protein VKE51_01290 [Vicinamibacterales bacterium]|nr:hypothetical protein [Vicinamibacterales bacterium]